MSGALWHLRERVRGGDLTERAGEGERGGGAKAAHSPDHVCAERDDVLHDRRNVQPDSDLRDKTGQSFSTQHANDRKVKPLKGGPARPGPADSHWRRW